MAMQMGRSHDHKTCSITTHVAFSEDELMQHTEEQIILRISEKVAQKYVEEHYGEIVARLDQQAIANLSIAEAAQRVAKVIHERPVVMQPDGPKTTVNKFSLF